MLRFLQCFASAWVLADVMRFTSEASSSTYTQWPLYMHKRMSNANNILLNRCSAYGLEVKEG